MAKLVWKLKSLMEEHGLKPLDIEREAIRLGYDIGKNVVYRLAVEGGPQRYDRDSLIAVIGALRSRTGKDLNVQDLLEYRE